MGGGKEDGKGEPSTYKLLQALNMRPFGKDTPKGGGDKGADWSKGSVVAGTGSLDLIVKLQPRSGAAVRRAAEAARSNDDDDGDGHASLMAGCLDLLWDTAADCNAQTRRWISSGWPRESLLLFAAGWEFMNMNRVVELSAQDATSLGRAYSCACSNVGVFNQGTVHGDIRLRSVFFGISQTVSAPSISTS
uniref:Uncharacterized protein n=4 Tax=Chrysotila carterae TaxID=13221 RepID=A0A7S4B9A2_CHRCT